MNSGFGLLILTSILISGYIFSSNCCLTRYFVSRAEGFGLQFYSGYFGFLVFLFPIIICMLLERNTDIFFNLYNKIKNQIPNLTQGNFKLIYLIVFTLLFSHLFALFINLITPQFIKRFVFRRAIKDSDFEKLLFNAISNELLVSISLESGKEYVGRIIMSIEPTTDNKEITLFPFMSGFRDNITKKVTYNTDYTEIYSLWMEQMYISDILDNIKDESEIELIEKQYFTLSRKIYGDIEIDISHVEMDDFNIVIPINNIVSSRVFDENVYNIFSKDLETKES